MYKIRGSIRDEAGSPLSGLFVEAYDKDLLADDYLGNSRTDSNGEFHIEFNEQAFKGIVEWLERKPDEFLIIRDAHRMLHRTEVRREAQILEVFDVKLSMADPFEDPYANAFSRTVAAFQNLVDVIDPGDLDLQLLIPQMIRTIEGWTYYTRPAIMKRHGYPGPQVPEFPKDEEHEHSLPWYSRK